MTTLLNVYIYQLLSPTQTNHPFPHFLICTLLLLLKSITFSPFLIKGNLAMKYALLLEWVLVPPFIFIPNIVPALPSLLVVVQPNFLPPTSTMLFTLSLHRRLKMPPKLPKHFRISPTNPYHQRQFIEGLK